MTTTSDLRLPRTECVETTWTRNEDGYGRRVVGGRRVYAHRYAWEQARGPIPPDLYVLHACDNPPCVNLDHLWLGTNADNIADRDAKGRQNNQRKTHCLRGHEFTPENTRYARGRRNCRRCENEFRAAWLAADPARMKRKLERQKLNRARRKAA